MNVLLSTKFIKVCDRQICCTRRCCVNRHAVWQHLPPAAASARGLQTGSVSQSGGLLGKSSLVVLPSLCVSCLLAFFRTPPPPSHPTRSALLSCPLLDSICFSSASFLPLGKLPPLHPRTPPSPQQILQLVFEITHKPWKPVVGIAAASAQTIQRTIRKRI